MLAQPSTQSHTKTRKAPAAAQEAASAAIEKNKPEKKSGDV